MATSTGKKSRRAHGNRHAAKRAKRGRKATKRFGKLPVSIVAGNAEAFVRANLGGW